MTFSIYIHYPFCLSKCPYCDFNSYKIRDIDEDKFLNAYLIEIENYYNLTKDKVVDTIFFGGGTPSIMNLKFLESLLNRIFSLWSINKNLEISMEANPTTIEINKFYDFKNLGINRLSIGIQSLNDEELKFLGRTHSREEAINSIKIAEKIFKEHYSIDLIYARPKQKIKSWIKELEEAVNLSPYHISLYQLVIEENTVFYIKKVKSLNDIRASKMYKITNDFLENYKINMYEVSNYSKVGYECKHNLNYWKSGEWIGIGAGAHGRICSGFFNDYNERYSISNFKSIIKWQNSIFNTGFGYKEKIKLNREEFIEEVLLMGLRLKNGINLNDINKYLKITDLHYLFNNDYIDFVDCNNFNLKVKKEYFNVLDSVILKLIK